MEITIKLRTDADFNIVKQLMVENFRDFEMTSGELRYENKPIDTNYT
ncbi:MAG: hypothetical protein ACOC56_06615 [Atribacterota bacterium]